MLATLTLTLDLRRAVPTAATDRLAWLERYGKPDTARRVELTAPLPMWASAGMEFNELGELTPYYPRLPGERCWPCWTKEPYSTPRTDAYRLPDGRRVEDAYPSWERLLGDALLARVTVSGPRGLELTADEVGQMIDTAGKVRRCWAADYAAAQAEVDRKRAIYAAEQDEAKAARKVADAAEAATKIRVAADAQQVRDEWVRQHGSERLKLGLAAGLLDSLLSVYRDERLALERPGWHWESDEQGVEVLHDPRQPTEAALRALIEAQRTDPGAHLQWSHTAHTWDCATQRDEDCDCDRETGGREVLASTYLGRSILLDVEGGRRQ